MKSNCLRLSFLFIILSLPFFGLTQTDEQENESEKDELEIIEAEHVAQDDRIFMIAESMPVFSEECDSIADNDEQKRCSDIAILNQIQSNLVYPEDARDAGYSGTVYIEFVVEKDGEITGAKVLRSIYASLDKEALRVTKQLKVYTPGMQLGKPVRVRYTIPIKFTIR